MFKVIKNFFHRVFQKKIFDTLYVGNLVYSASILDLKNSFAKFGTIKNARIIRDPQTKKSKGYGFITFQHSQSAKKALNMEGYYLKGRPIKVRFAHSRPQLHDKKSYRE